MAELQGFTNQPKQKGSRTRRYILASIIFLLLALAATQIFLQQTSVGSPRFIRMTFLLYTATVVVVLALLILATVLGRNLIKLYFERKSGLVGSGFKSKMVRTFIVLSLLPALLLFLLAYSLLSSSIEQWFRAAPAQMMENSRLLAQQYYSEAEKSAKYFAANIAGFLQAGGDWHPGAGPQLREKLRAFCSEYALGNVRVYDARGRVAADAGYAISTSGHQEVIRQLIAQTILGQQRFHVMRVSPRDALNEITWATAPVWDAGGHVAGAVLTETINTQSARFRADSVTEAYDKYEQLRREESALRFNSLLILVVATLLIVFAFAWFALYLAKRITVPIQALAEGAAAVAAGNLGHRVECQAFDELGSLVASFNRMTGDLQENERRIEAGQRILRQTNVELDDRRRYIETILQTIGTGVISFDLGYRIRTMNRAAMEMLQVPGLGADAGFEEVLQAPISDILRALLQKSAVLGTVTRNIELPFPGKSLQLAATVTPLLDGAGQRTGWVMVLEDMTELLRMEKMSAWQEVARRMAHEIKNPLTPIQLSAERVLNRYRQMAPLRTDVPKAWEAELAKFDKLLNECVQTIIQEAGSLKGLVDEFSRFARLPEARLEETDLNRILENTLNLYDGRISDVSVQKELDSGIPKLRLDPEQMKRVFINLFDNALEAMAENRNRKVLQLRTRCNAPQGVVTIEVGDTGRGFPEEYRDSVFLPYFSARKGGTGLGLAIVRQIITDHHGNVHAESNMPVGTRIIIDLPLAPA
jgi:two-component system nitrogen regulation sensor histidine kinase NtrY